MSTDAWEEIQAVKCKRNSLRERLENRKRQRQEILGSTVLNLAKKKKPDEKTSSFGIPTKLDHRVEQILLKVLCDISLTLPITSNELLNLITSTSTNNTFEIRHEDVCGWLQKFSDQKLIRLNESNKTSESVCLEIIFADSSNLMKLCKETTGSSLKTLTKSNTLDFVGRDRCASSTNSEEKTSKNAAQCSDDCSTKQTDELMALLSTPSTKEKATKKIGEEILFLLNKPTAKERSLMERFRSQDGGKVTQFCDDGTRKDCRKNRSNCSKLHFKKIIQKHTDESLGDCSFLNTCFHMDSCKYVHYEVEKIGTAGTSGHANRTTEPVSCKDIAIVPQWIQCDLRFFDMSVLGKFAVIMADPPWDIHMELPYGTMSDDEMKQLDIPVLQDEGLLFLWVTGRAMELGRDCLKLWGYDRVDELIWVKTNQLQRIIRTGRTGHWLNHGKEHCLVGMKGNPKGLNRGIDCDVIVAEVRATSHKPDEIYGIIERLSPGSKKIELFGRMHNIQPNWLTLGNQVDGVKIVDAALIEAFKKRYPNGNCMINDKKLALMM